MRCWSAGYFVKASGIAIKHVLTRPSADVSDIDSNGCENRDAGGHTCWRELATECGQGYFTKQQFVQSDSSSFTECCGS
jgi:hypothetical protein